MYAALEPPKIGPVELDSFEIPFAKVDSAELGSSGLDFVELESAALDSAEIEFLNSQPLNSRAR